MENKLNNEKNHNLSNNQTNYSDNNELEILYEILGVKVLENKQKIFYNNLDIYLKYENEYQSKKILDDLDSL